MTNVVQFRNPKKPSTKIDIPRMNKPVEDKDWYLSSVAQAIEFALFITQDYELAELLLKRFIEGAQNNQGMCEFTAAEMTQVYHYVNPASPFYFMLVERRLAYFASCDDF